jgi:hypothetical protein
MFCWPYPDWGGERPRQIWMVLTFAPFNLSTRNFTIFPKIYLLRNAVSLLRRHHLSIIGQNLLAGKKSNSGDACQNKILDQLCNPCGPTMLPPPPRENTTKCQKLCYPYSHRMRLFLFRHNSKKYRSRIWFLCCKLLQIWMKHWLFCTYNGWPEFNEIQTVKPRRNCVNRATKCEMWMEFIRIFATVQFIFGLYATCI